MTRREQIEAICSRMTKVEAIGLLESISKDIRRKNSIRINSRKFMEVKVDERPDELKLKGDL